MKLNALASPLDWWAPTNWQTLDSTDADLGSSMPTLLPGSFLFQSGKDSNGYLLNGAALGHVSPPVAQASGFCSGGSFGGAVYDPGNSTIYASCNSGLKALSFAAGPTPSITAKAGFSAPAGATGPPMIAGGLVWVTNHSTGTLFGLDPTSGTTRSQFSIPENTIPGGSDVNHFATPSAGGGRLFVGSGDQVTAYTIAQAPAPTSTSTTLAASPNPTPAGGAVSLTATVAPTPDGGTITFTDGGAPIAGCSGIAVSAATAGQAACRTAFARPGTHTLAASYSGDAFYAASTSVACWRDRQGRPPDAVETASVLAPRVDRGPQGPRPVRQANQEEQAARQVPATDEAEDHLHAQHLRDGQGDAQAPCRRSQGEESLRHADEEEPEAGTVHSPGHGAGQHHAPRKGRGERVYAHRQDWPPQTSGPAPIS